MKRRIPVIFSFGLFTVLSLHAQTAGPKYYDCQDGRRFSIVFSSTTKPRSAHISVNGEEAELMHPVGTGTNGQVFDSKNYEFYHWNKIVTLGKPGGHGGVVCQAVTAVEATGAKSKAVAASNAARAQRDAHDLGVLNGQTLQSFVFPIDYRASQLNLLELALQPDALQTPNAMKDFIALNNCHYNTRVLNRISNEFDYQDLEKFYTDKAPGIFSQILAHKPLHSFSSVIYRAKLGSYDFTRRAFAVLPDDSGQTLSFDTIRLPISDTSTGFTELTTSYGHEMDGCEYGLFNSYAVKLDLVVLDYLPMPEVAARKFTESLKTEQTRTVWIELDYEILNQPPTLTQDKRSVTFRGQATGMKLYSGEMKYKPVPQNVKLNTAIFQAIDKAPMSRVATATPLSALNLFGAHLLAELSATDLYSQQTCLNLDVAGACQGAVAKTEHIRNSADGIFSLYAYGNSFPMEHIFAKKHVAPKGGEVQLKLDGSHSPVKVTKKNNDGQNLSFITTMPNGRKETDVVLYRMEPGEQARMLNFTKKKDEWKQQKKYGDAIRDFDRKSKEDATIFTLKQPLTDGEYCVEINAGEPGTEYFCFSYPGTSALQ